MKTITDAIEPARPHNNAAFVINVPGPINTTGGVYLCTGGEMVWHPRTHANGAAANWYAEGKTS